MKRQRAWRACRRCSMRRPGDQPLAWWAASQRVLVERHAQEGRSELAGRTECNRWVNFSGPASLLQRFVDVMRHRGAAAFAARPAGSCMTATTAQTRRVPGRVGARAASAHAQALNLTCHVSRRHRPRIRTRAGRQRAAGEPVRPAGRESAAARIAARGADSPSRPRLSRAGARGPKRPSSALRELHGAGRRRRCRPGAGAPVHRGAGPAARGAARRRAWPRLRRVVSAPNGASATCARRAA